MGIQTTTRQVLSALA